MFRINIITPFFIKTIENRKIVKIFKKFVYGLLKYNSAIIKIQVTPYVKEEGMNQKWLKVTEIFDEYERRFCAARADKELLYPWKDCDRSKIIESVKRMIGYDESYVPNIRCMDEILQTEYEGYSAIQYRFESWEKVYGSATLYLPDKKEKMPLVFVCCGHGKMGRLTSSYMAMGHRLASLGMAALVIDNIGQGDRCRVGYGRHDPDHWTAVAPFNCGLTLQGLIVMETIGLIRHMAKDVRFDSTRLGACGNSGGGTLTMFLAALAPELSVIASSGYPAEIFYIMQKEREHCACNLFVGQAYEAEMWEIYSTFAPKPLLLSGGVHDNLFPQDLVHRNARKVKNTYVQMDAADSFGFELTDTKHSWEISDVNLISGFLSKRLLGVDAKDSSELFETDDVADFQVPLPQNSLATAELSEMLTGIKSSDDIKLSDVFVPTYKGKPIDPDIIQTDVGRGDVMRVFAQFECALAEK